MEQELEQKPPAAPAIITTSKRFQLGWSDIKKSVIVAGATAGLFYVQSKIPGWHIPDDIKGISSAFVGYLLKNLMEKSKVQINNLTPENISSIKDGTTQIKLTDAK